MSNYLNLSTKTDTYFPHYRTPTKKRFIAIGIAVVLLTGIVSTYCLVLSKDNVRAVRIFGHGAVAANGQECADIGISILTKGGSAADAAIAVMLCEGITCNLIFYDNKFIFNQTIIPQVLNPLDLAVDFI